MVKNISEEPHEIISQINYAIINNLDIYSLSAKYSSILGYTDYIGFKPFFLAILLGRASHIETLIECNSSLIDEEDVDGKNPLYVAADIGHQHIISLLIRNKADINKALYLAIKNDNTDILQNLINKKSSLNNKDIYNQSMIHFSAQLNSIKSLIMLIEIGANINLKNNNGDTALNIALKFENNEAAKILIKNKADLMLKNNNQQSALYIAAQNEMTELFPLIASNSKILNESLQLAINSNCTTVLAILLDYANKNSAKYQIKDNLFSLAAKIGNVDIMMILIGKKTYLDQSDIYHRSALHFAVENDKYDVAKILIENGANIYKMDNFSRTPYSIAAERNQSELLLSFLIGKNISAASQVNLQKTIFTKI
jgi:ankyrin repeat protein